MGDEVVVVGVEGARKPAAGFALVGAKPVEAALDLLVLRGYPCLAKDVDDEARAVTIAGAVLVIQGRLAVLVFLVALVVTERRETPAAVGSLDGEQFLHGLVALLGTHQAVELHRSPQQHGLMVQVGGGVFLEVAAQLLEALARLGTLAVLVGSVPDAQGG